MRSAKYSICIAHASLRSINSPEPITSFTSATDRNKHFPLFGKVLIHTQMCTPTCTEAQLPSSCLSFAHPPLYMYRFSREEDVFLFSEVVLSLPFNIFLRLKRRECSDTKSTSWVHVTADSCTTSWTALRCENRPNAPTDITITKITLVFYGEKRSQICDFREIRIFLPKWEYPCRVNENP